MKQIIIIIFCLIFIAAKKPLKNIVAKKPFAQIKTTRFRTFTLPNELQVLVVTDKKFIKSAASLVVEVGSFADPDSHPGLAHFLEHMIFVNTKEYPEIDGFMKFCSKNRGNTNAQTTDLNTNYYFDMNSSSFAQGLIMFSRFFVAPTFNDKYVQKELNAIDSEFAKLLNSEGWRFNALEKQLSKKNHPFSRFSIGNHETLKNATVKDLKEFYNKYYSANRMNLTIMTDKPFSEIKKLVIDNFSDIKNKKLPKLKYDNKQIVKKYKQKIVYVKTLKDYYSMDIAFDTPSFKKYNESKPLSFIAYLIGEEGSESLLEYFKNKGWALSLNTYLARSKFVISVGLTKEGRENYVEIYNTIFSYIAKIRKKQIPISLFKSRKALWELNLKEYDVGSSGSKASAYSYSMTHQKIPTKNSLFATLNSYSKSAFIDVMRYLTPDKAVIYIQSKTEKTNAVVAKFNLAYRVADKKYNYKIDSKLVKDIDYPEVNKFIPKKFKLVNKNYEISKAIIIKDKYGESLLQTDTELRSAKALIKNVLTSNIKKNIRNYVLNTLFVASKLEELKPWTYFTSKTYVYFSLVGSGSNKISVSLSGFTDHLYELFDKYIKGGDSFTSLNKMSLSKVRFAKLKEVYLRNLHNNYIKNPSYRFSLAAWPLSIADEYHFEDVLKEVKLVSYNDVVEYGKKFFKNLIIITAAYGNINAKQVKKIRASIIDNLKIKPKLSMTVNSTVKHYRRIPTDKHYVYPIYGSNNNNAMYELWNLGEWSIQNAIKASVATEILGKNYFTELRTKQQLGYSVSASFVNSNEIYLQSEITSHKYSPQELSKRSSKFLKNFLLKKSIMLTQKKLQSIKNSIFESLHKKSIGVYARGSNVADNYFTYMTNSEVEKIYTKALKKLSLNDIKKFLFDAGQKIDKSYLKFYYFGAKYKNYKYSPLRGETLLNRSVVKNAKWKLYNPIVNKF